jgi:VCBS repeat-containing protein
MGRQPRVYDSVLDAGNQTLAQLSTTWRTTYFAVTAYDTDGLESDFSDEVSYTSPGLNALPIAQADQYVATRNSTLSVLSAAGVLANDSDADGDPLTVLIVNSATQGTLSLNANGSFSYTPAPNFTGSDSFSYRAADGFATSAVAVVTLTVLASNSVPTAQPDQFVTAKNVALNVSPSSGILANDFDADGETLAALLVSSTSHGALSVSANGSFSYTPVANYSGSDFFSYRVTDGKANSAVALVSITINPSPNSAPIAPADHYVTPKNTPLNRSTSGGVLANDADADGDVLAAWLVTSVSHGTLTLNGNGSFNYVPASNFSGTDSFSYRAFDGRATSAVAAVTIVVDQNTPTSTNCLECFTSFDAALFARSNAFRGVVAARLSVPTNITCPQAGVFLFDTLCRSLKGIEDAQIRSELAAVSECLAANLQDESMLRLATASQLSGSKWTTAASNQVATTRRNLERALATTNEMLRAQLLASAVSLLLRADRSITAGDLAPAALTDKNIVSKISGNGNTSPLEFSFTDQSVLITQTTDGRLLTVGTYAYTRTAWNCGTVVFAFDTDIFGHRAGEVISVGLKFSRPRSRIVGSLRGYFVMD